MKDFITRTDRICILASRHDPSRGVVESCWRNAHAIRAVLHELLADSTQGILIRSQIVSGRGANVGMPSQFLDKTDVYPTIAQVSAIRVAQDVRRKLLVYARAVTQVYEETRDVLPPPPLWECPRRYKESGMRVEALRQVQLYPVITAVRKEDGPEFLTLAFDL